jgi:hypothetical protein
MIEQLCPQQTPCALHTCAVQGKALAACTRLVHFGMTTTVGTPQGNSAACLAADDAAAAGSLWALWQGPLAPSSLGTCEQHIRRPDLRWRVVGEAVTIDNTS